jgi:hypothetical protein
VGAALIGNLALSESGNAPVPRGACGLAAGRPEPGIERPWAAQAGPDRVFRFHFALAHEPGFLLVTDPRTVQKL